MGFTNSATCHATTTWTAGAGHGRAQAQQVQGPGCDAQHCKQQRQHRKGSKEKLFSFQKTQRSVSHLLEGEEEDFLSVYRVLMQEKDLLWPGRVNNYFAFKISPLSEQSQATDRERRQPNITAKEQASRIYQFLRLPRRPDKRSMKLAKEINLNSQHISAQLFILTINLAKDN